MLYPDRATVCVSTQAGCAMGCGFCATGQAGFDRHLTAGEIVEQVVRAARAGPATAAGGCRNVVFMGMGEPLANYDRGVGRGRAASTATSACRPATSRSRPSASCPASAASPSEPLPVNLAVSLHAANDALRDELVPINRRYPLDVLVDACAALPRGQGPAAVVRVGADRRRQRPRQRRRASWPTCAGACRSRAHVNLIPLNPTPGLADHGHAAGAGAARSATCCVARASTPRSAATAAPTSTPPAASWPPGSR